MAGKSLILRVLPEKIKNPLRKVKHFLSLIPKVLQPTKMVNTVFYHLGLYKIANRRYQGLHLGGGNLRIPHFLNVDGSVYMNCDVTGGVEKIKLKSGSIDIIYASHVFEHISRARINTVLKEWLRVLRPGGKLFLCVPDLEVLARVYLENLPDYNNEDGRYKVDLATGILYGGQTSKYDFHYFGYSYPTLKSLLESIGFSNMQRFDRNELHFAPFDDAGYTTIKGTAISLNIEATK